MSEKTNISEMQMGFLLFPVIVATADLIVPAITTKYAERDMWLSPVLASLMGVLTVFLIFRLHALYPRQSIIQYSSHIVGVIPGKIMAFLILYNFLYSNGNILRLYGEFIVGSFLSETPLLVVIGSITLLCALTVRTGVEVIARTAQVLVPVIVFFYMGILCLMIPFMKVENMFPMLAHGFTPALRGALTPQGWYSEVILFSFLVPYVSDYQKGMRTGMATVLCAMFALFFLNLSALLILGPEVATMTYPFYTAIQMISYADFFENVDAIVIAIWVAGAFVKITMFYFALSLGTAQWLGLDDYRPIVFPIGFLLVLFSFWTAPDMSTLSSNIGKMVGFQSSGISSGIPLLLFIIALLRSKYKSRIEKALSSPSNE
ncbi:GerAB/ArcD/ProY family transporter [Brevibacillus sp. NRS-1366]|uniref:GerAB/ArcD/ProY family transporter n=1 Tax=Brevibacillus sp. NRS-1366 TaxID=3233899 RepID=UPI003D1B1B7B